MAVRNLGWYNRGEATAYPIDEAASSSDDAGQRLPADIITDLNLRWPSTEGLCAFVTAVSVTDTLVTLTIQSAELPSSSGGATALAAVSVRRPVDIGRMYQLKPQADGVGGWVVFGRGANGVKYSGRFSTPAQSRLVPRAARSYRPFPVASLSVRDAAVALTGIVRLRAREPLQIVKEQREIEGVVRDCIVVRLIDNASTDFPVPSTAISLLGGQTPSVFQQFSGPCAGRPESDTCGDPQPIEYINAVGPDCNGVLTLEFAGCAQVTQIMSICGLAVDCQFGLTDACLPAQLPNSAGLLPSEYQAADVPDTDYPPPPEPEPGNSESITIVGQLPYFNCFNGEASSEMTDISGDWDWSGDDDSPTSCYQALNGDPGSASVSSAENGVYASYSTAMRSVTIWDGFDDQTTFRRVTTEVKLIQGPFGAKHNAGLVLNYRPGDIAGQYVYHIAEIDYDTQQFRITRFNGATFQEILRTTLPGIDLDQWYRITATVVPHTSPGQTSISARLESVTGAPIDATLTTVVNDYVPSTGRFGLGSWRAIAYFDSFKVEEYGG